MILLDHMTAWKKVGYVFKDRNSVYVSLVLNSQLLVAVGTPRHSSYKHIRVELLMLCTGAILMVHQHCTRSLEN